MLFLIKQYASDSQLYHTIQRITVKHIIRAFVAIYIYDCMIEQYGYYSDNFSYILQIISSFFVSLGFTIKVSQKTIHYANVYSTHKTLS